MSNKFTSKDFKCSSVKIEIPKYIVDFMKEVKKMPREEMTKEGIQKLIDNFDIGDIKKVAACAYLAGLTGSKDLLSMSIGKSVILTGDR